VITERNRKWHSFRNTRGEKGEGQKVRGGGGNEDSRSHPFGEREEKETSGQHVLREGGRGDGRLVWWGGGKKKGGGKPESKKKRKRKGGECHKHGKKDGGPAGIEEDKKGGRGRKTLELGGRGGGVLSRN